ncbi:TIM barrel protein [Puniceibacterium antarcticum]|uniref:TIM barrel protein n=1 Tax=Puniceibacterium antarcticum TaxID=1206336 RepID=UPI0031834310
MPVLKQHWLESSMCKVAELSLDEGWADRVNHDALTENYLHHIDLVAQAGYRNLIQFSGNRRDMNPAEGMQNYETGLRRILDAAEERGVVLHMELLNSRVNHPDYLFDATILGVDLCRGIRSCNFKLLYDIYHIPFHDCLGHDHTAGNPMRCAPRFLVVTPDAHKILSGGEPHGRQHALRRDRRRIGDQRRISRKGADREGAEGAAS